MAVKLNADAGTMVDVKNYFGYTGTASFSADWKGLSEDDKAQLKNGVGKGVDKVTGEPPVGATLDY